VRIQYRASFSVLGVIEIGGVMAGTGDEPQANGEDEPDPRARLMHEVAEQMDAIDADYPDGFEIGRVITVVEVFGPNESVDVRVRAGQLPWVALGMLDWAKKNMEKATLGGTPGPASEGEGEGD
jgi:hypothetical protein